MPLDDFQVATVVERSALSGSEIDKAVSSLVTNQFAFLTVVGMTRKVYTNPRSKFVAGVFSRFKRPFFDEFRKFLEHEDYLDRQFATLDIEISSWDTRSSMAYRLYRRSDVRSKRRTTIRIA